MNSPLFKAGQALPSSTFKITREQIREYAKASGDNNPIHLDEAVARAAGLPGVIAQGMLELGILGTLACGWAADPTRIRRLGCRFSGMTLPGDTLTYFAVVTSVEADLVRIEAWAENQRGDTVLSKAVVEISMS